MTAQRAIASGSRGGCPPRLPQNRACAVHTRLLGTAGCEPRRRPCIDLDLSPLQRELLVGGGDDLLVPATVQIHERIESAVREERGP
jgi:hypothetical protein